jgi:hypothetical protein
MFFEMGLDMGQNFNRYSYCLNNPLLYSDPSGNSWISDAFHWVKKTIWDTPWRWLNGSDKGHPGVYSGGFSQKLDKWGAPSFGAGYNSSQGGFYYMGNNPRVYPAMEAALQRQYAGVTAQTQAMIAGERQQRQLEKPQSFEGVRVYVEHSKYLGDGAGMTIPGVGIFVGPEDAGNINLLRHEFGHILQYQKWGAMFYWTQVVPASIKSANVYKQDAHMQTWTEWSANRLSYEYFGRPKDWDIDYYKIFPASVRISGAGPSFPSSMTTGEFLFNYLYK